MPTIRAGAPSTGTVRPTIDSSPPNALRQSSLESTCYVFGARQRVFARELPAANRRDPQGGHELGGDDGRRHAAGLVGGAYVARASAIRANLRERTIVLRELDELRCGHPELIEPELRKLARDENQPLRRRIRQRLQDDAVDDAEDGGIGANSQGQRQDRDRGITRALAQAAKRIREVLSHGSSLSKRGWRSCLDGCGSGLVDGPALRF